jgi:succinate dehydrogenase flavin-adding protein (antitoxin of CptAB toxin-antitoxin module)
VIITALSNTKDDIFYLVEDQFKKDEEVLSEIVKKIPEHLYHIENNLAQKIRKNVNVMSVLISNDPQMFHELKEKEKSEYAYLKLMLKNIPNFNEVKEYLAANKDPEIALMAVKLTKKSIPYLHRNFQKIIEKCDNQKDIYTFFKIQLINEKNRNSANESKALKNNL